MKKILSLVAIVFAIALFANNADARNPNNTSTSTSTTTINTDTGNVGDNVKKVVTKNGKTVVKTRNPIINAIAKRISEGGKNK